MNELKILGRVIGTFDGWDSWDGDMDEMVFYKYQPEGTIQIQPCDLSVNYTDGVFKSYDDNGELLWSKDIIETISHLSKPF